MKNSIKFNAGMVAALLLAGATRSAWAVDHDLTVPCWRDGTSATRQVWDFESNANPINPGTSVNLAGTASASMFPIGGGTGHTTNSCLKGLGGCGTAVYAVLPLDEDPCDGAGPYLSNLGRLAVDGGCALTAFYTDPPADGTAYGYWNIGVGRTVLTIPNNGAPAGTTRYFHIQSTYFVDSGITTGYPSTYGVTNGAGVGNTTTGIKTRTLMEQPLDANGDLQSGTWNNERLVMSVATDTSAGNDTLTIRGTAKYWLEAAIVETLDRAAVSDTMNAVKNATTNIPFATLLANDRGSTNIVGAGGAVNGTVTHPPVGGVVQFIPTPGFTGLASFWYTNNDCANLTEKAAQVTVLVLPSGVPDISKPTVLFATVPADKSRVFTTPTNIVGTAKDAPAATASGVYQVLFGANGGPINNLATLTTNSVTGGISNWTAAVAMNPGTNTLRIKSVDLAGNISLTNTRTYILSVTSHLGVAISGYGIITPTTFVGSGTPTNDAMLELNRAYTVEAKLDTNAPGVNYVFSNWLASVDGGPVFVASTNKKYTFLMQTNLSLTAVFETNRFIGAAGGYFGLFTDEATPIVSLERSGFFTFVPTRKQAFSGKLYLDGNALGYAGTLNLDGYGVSKPILRKGKATAFVTVQMTFDGSDSVSGTLYTTSNAPSPYVPYPTPFTSVLTGFKAEYNLTNNPATNLVGTYTMAVDVPTAPESPKGNCVANLTVKSNGMVTVDSMYLGDYASLKPPFAAYLSKNGDWPLFAYTYKANMPYTVGVVPKTNKEFAGMIWGWMKFTNNTGINVIPGTNSGRELLDSYLDWIKYPNTNNFYEAGFTNHDLAVHGSAYLKPTNTLSIRVLDITDGNIEFADGNLTSSMSNHFFMKTNSMIIFQVPNVNTQTCTIAYPSGKVTGKFTHPNDTAHPAHLFTGVILQDENIARGAFTGTNASGSFLLKSD